MEKSDFLKNPVSHIDIKSFNSSSIIEAYRDMSSTARDTARAADIYNRMLTDDKCTIILCIAGSTSAAGCMQIYIDMVRCNMVDVVVVQQTTHDFGAVSFIFNNKGMQFAHQSVSLPLFCATGVLSSGTESLSGATTSKSSTMVRMFIGLGM